MKHRGNILIIDDDVDVLKGLELTLKHEFENVYTEKNPNIIPHHLDDKDIDAVLLDMNFRAGADTGNEGIFWMNKILDNDPTYSVVLITAYGDVELAVKAIKQGAMDFVIKPWDNNKLIATLRTAVKLSKTASEVQKSKNKQQALSEESNKGFSELIGQTLQMRQLQKDIDKIAITDANVLITGENGTGKELVARAIHRKSNRANEVFITADLGSLNESLFESELFGHVKGAFTDALQDRIGRFQAASGGSLFLDEIGNLTINMQSKILTALQNRSIAPVGSNKNSDVDIRLVSATNKNLKRMVSEHLFREDLLYRLNTINLHIPPLRDRGDDIILLAEYFLEQYSGKYDKHGVKMNKNAV